ncbi:baseplate J/gp47 family protein [Candidatus Saccharibacteria bacterium]|nr:baseplate J/gp47 family protein [Candidatus Saccharibacteria bacterium]
MTKETIYLDLADDITTISAKVTRAKSQLVVLVLPKSLGALRNIVNIRLLSRVATRGKKSIVLVSNNPEILPLAGQVGLPVAKSLRDKPVLPPKPDQADSHGSTIDEPDDPAPPIGFTDLEDEAAADVAATDPLSDGNLVPKVKLADTKKSTETQEVKSFKDWFKKYARFVLIPIGVIILAIISVIVFVPARATIEITARTSRHNFNEPISFTRNAGEANPEAGVFLLHSETLEKVSEYEFTATGSREIGEYASGQITFTYAGLPANIPSNTAITIGSHTYRTTEATTANSGQVTLNVRATALGDEFNRTSGGAFSITLAGTPHNFTATAMSITGGSKRTITIVSQSDYDSALAALPVVNRQAAETELANNFAADLIALPRAAFTSSTSDPTSSAAVDAEVGSDQRITIRQTTTFTGYGVNRADLETFIRIREEERVAGEDSTKIFDLGFDRMFFGNFSEANNQMTSRLQTTTVVGPDISEDSVKEAVAGRSASDANRAIQSRDITNATVRFNFFWVNRVPTQFDHITVEIRMGD